MKTKMCTARPGWQTMSFRKPMYKKNMFQIECNLIDILEVDVKRKVSVSLIFVTRSFRCIFSVYINYYYFYFITVVTQTIISHILYMNMKFPYQFYIYNYTS